MRIEEIRSDLCARLRSRRPEIEEAILTRVQGVSGPGETADPDYAQGLRAAVGAAIDYGIAGLERSEDRPPPIPTALLSQARLAARNRVSLDTVLRRYLAGYTLLGDFMIEEAEGAKISRGGALKRLLRAQAALLDRILTSVAEEYGRESKRPSSSEERRTERIERLLNGAPLDTSELAYEFGGWHLGFLATGQGASEAIAALAKPLDCRLLSVSPSEGTVWAWLGSRRKLDSEDLEGLRAAQLPSGLILAMGEPGEGISGWRLTHRQAKAALSVALRGEPAPVRYLEVALVASMLGDELLLASLRELYLAPLEREGDGETLRETLGAYFSAGRNASSAAAILGVNRQTVTRRLAAIERRLERSLGACGLELEAALRLQKLGGRSS